MSPRLRPRRIRLLAMVLLAAASAALAGPPRTVSGLTTPESVLAGSDGRVYVSEIGGFGKDGDGRITAIDAQGRTRAWATEGLDDPKGLAERRGYLYVTDKTRVVRIDRRGKVTVFAAADAFPRPPTFLNDLAFDAAGNLYVSDTGDFQQGGGGAIFRIAPDGRVTLVVDEAANPAIRNPNGLLAEGKGRLLVLDFATGTLLRLDTATGRTETVADGFGGGDGLARDAAGVLYLSDWRGGQVWKLDPKRAGAPPVRYEQAFQSAADIAVSRDGRHVLVPDMKAGSLVWMPK